MPGHRSLLASAARKHRAALRAPFGRGIAPGLIALCCLAADGLAATFPAIESSLGEIPLASSPTCNLGLSTPRDVTFEVSGLTGAPTDVQVSLTFTHAYIGNLVVELVAPDGATSQTLFGRTGATASGDCGDDSNAGGTYVFSDETPLLPTVGWWQAADAAGNDDVLAPGTYRTTESGGPFATNPPPPTSLTAAFAGLPDANGTWALRFYPLSSIGTGTVRDATLDVVAASAPRAKYLYWANTDGGAGTTIGRATIVGNAVSDVRPAFIAGAAGPCMLATNAAHIFWANRGGNTIGRARLDGTEVEQDFITGADGPCGVFVDDTHVYWTNLEGGGIGRAGLDGSNTDPHAFSTSSQPCGVVVHAGNVLYGGPDDDGLGDGFINSMPLGGGDPLLNFGVRGQPCGLAMSSVELYWAGWGKEKGTVIGRMELAYNRRQVLIDGVSSPCGIAVDDEHVFWANQGTDTIGQAELDGTPANPSLISVGNAPCGVALSPVVEMPPGGTTTTTLQSDACGAACVTTDPCRPRACVAGACVTGELSVLAGARCACQRSAPAVCGDSQPPVKVQAAVAKACILLDAAAAQPAGRSRLRKLRKASRNWRTAVRLVFKRPAKRVLTPECIAALAADFDDATDRVNALREAENH